VAKNNCCHAFVYKKVDLEQKKRRVCKQCGFIDYRNPKLVSGSLVLKNNKFLLCKRAIEPSYGKWTFPSGYIDEGETPEEGAIREAKEEVNIKIKLEKLFIIFTVRNKNLIQFVFIAKQLNKTFKPGIETLDAKYFDYDEIPWKSLAFPSVAYAIKKFRKYSKKRLIFHTFSKDLGF
jgi:ADP-ribose pyrophosphatase YjhB (NUDIX family)